MTETDTRISTEFKVTGRFEWNSNGQFIFIQDEDQPSMDGYLGYWSGHTPNPLTNSTGLVARAGELLFSPVDCCGKQKESRTFQLAGIVDPEFSVLAREFIRLQRLPCQNCNRLRFTKDEP